MSATKKQTLIIVFFTVFLDLIGFGIIIPIQPFFAQELGASPTLITILGASFSFMQFLFSPLWGRLSDRVGRKPVMLISIAFTSVGYFWFGLAKTLPMLFAARMLAGFGSANLATAQAIIADSTTPETRAKGMGIIGVAFGLGFILGPALGGFFGQYGLTVPAYVASFLSMANWFLALAILPETYPKEIRVKGRKDGSHGFSLKALVKASQHKNVPQLFSIFLIYATAFSMMEQSIGLFLEHHFVTETDSILRAKEAARLTGFYLMVVGITATIVQGGFIGRLVPKFGERKILLLGILCVGTSLCLVPFVGTFKIFALMCMMASFTAFGTGLTNPSILSLLSRSVSRDEQGGTLGLGQSLGGLGRVIGPSFAGFLFEHAIGLPFWIAGGLILFCLLIARTLTKS